MSRWPPSIERNGRFLLVEEEQPEGIRLNQPAGHLGPGETPVDGAIRETLEETACGFAPAALLGVYMARSSSAREATPVTYLRFAFIGSVGDAEPGRPLDTGILRTLWLTADEVRARIPAHRSPLVMKCIDDYLAGQRYPLSLVYAHPICDRMNKGRVVIGMSGGVDSSVAAWLLKQQGYEVVGLFMKNWEDDDDDEYCSTRQDLIDAAAAADVVSTSNSKPSTSPPNTRTGCLPSSCASTRPAARRIRTCCAMRRSSSRRFSITRSSSVRSTSRRDTTRGCGGPNHCRANQGVGRGSPDSARVREPAAMPMGC